MGSLSNICVLSAGSTTFICTPHNHIATIATIITLDLLPALFKITSYLPAFVYPVKFNFAFQVFIICILSAEKYQHFQGVLTTYIEKHFSAAMAHKYVNMHMIMFTFNNIASNTVFTQSSNRSIVESFCQLDR